MPTLPPAPATDGDSPYALNDRLRPVEAIGLDRIDGPEDVILDEDDNIYVGNRTGDIVRFLAPDYSRQEVFAHIGGRPLGMAFARDGSLLCCIGGMGLYRVTRDRDDREADRRDKPILVLDHRQFPPAARRRSRHRAGRARLLQRGDDPLRDARVAGRLPGIAGQRPHRLLRPEHRHDAHGAEEPRLPERHLHDA